MQEFNTLDFVKTFFRDEKGNPIILTPSQKELFELIFFKKHPYNQIVAFTRYGKSFITSLAVLSRCIFVPEKWAIVAPTEKHAKIIMNYIIEHCFDNELFISKLQLEEGESLERLRRERSKRRLTFKIYSGNNLSEIFILSAHSTKEDPLKSLLGFGSQNVVLDESSLIDDKVYAGVLRMLGDSKEPFLLEIGNPVKKNHFWETYNDPKFNKMVIDYQVGLKEGRITQEQVELMKNQYGFDVLYECKFPSSAEGISEDLLVFENNRDIKECDLFAIGTDLAISEKEEADESAIVVAGRIRGTSKVKVFNAISGKFSMNEMLNLVRAYEKMYSQVGLVMVGVENVAYQKVFGEELQRRFLISPYYVKRTTDKRSRFLMLTPYFQNRQIVFAGTKEDFKDLIEQILNFGTLERDDLVDAFEMATSLLKDYLIEEKKPEEPKTYEEMRKLEIAEAIKRKIEGETGRGNEFTEYYEY